MKLKMMLLAMCMCGGTAAVFGNSAEKPEAPKAEEVKTTAEDNVAKADEGSKEETKESRSDCSSCTR